MASGDYVTFVGAAAHVCRIFFRLRPKKVPEDVMTLISEKLIPICKERSVPRLRRPVPEIFQEAEITPVQGGVIKTVSEYHSTVEKQVWACLFAMK